MHVGILDEYVVYNMWVAYSAALGAALADAASVWGVRAATMASMNPKTCRIPSQSPQSMLYLRLQSLYCCKHGSTGLKRPCEQQSMRLPCALVALQQAWNPKRQ